MRVRCVGLAKHDTTGMPVVPGCTFRISVAEIRLWGSIKTILGHTNRTEVSRRSLRRFWPYTDCLPRFAPGLFDRPTDEPLMTYDHIGLIQKRACSSIRVCIGAERFWFIAEGRVDTSLNYPKGRYVAMER